MRKNTYLHRHDEQAAIVFIRTKSARNCRQDSIISQDPDPLPCTLALLASTDAIIPQRRNRDGQGTAT